MKSLYVLPLLLLAVWNNLAAQSLEKNEVEPLTEVVKVPKKKGELYLTWGYHADAYTRSTIHLKDHISDDYDFTLYNAKATDRPDMHNLLHTPLTVPQYVIRIGYMFNGRRDLGIEFSWDHLKYIVLDNQMMHLKGTIHEVYYDKDTLVTPDFVHFEHTNGNNYAMVSLVKRFMFMDFRHQKLSVMTTTGAGILVPKTDSRILGNHNDGPFRYSGMVVGVSAGLRYEVFKYFYIEPSFKGAYANYTDAKVYLHGRAKHSFYSAQYIFAFGVSVPL